MLPRSDDGLAQRVSREYSKRNERQTLAREEYQIEVQANFQVVSAETVDQSAVEGTTSARCAMRGNETTDSPSGFAKRGIRPCDR